MIIIKETSLWKSAFSVDNSQCKMLEVAFDTFRERAATLANEIIIDQPTFTVHDITHIDALWNMASLITGEIEMTPTEGFVLGGAFLIHDIAMSLSAYPKGMEEIKSLPEWNDTIYTLIKKENGSDYSEIDLTNIPPKIEEAAKQILLRNLHAIKARELCNEKWPVNGIDYYLIDNPDLRETFGDTIGEIAASHWWSIEDVRDKLKYVLGAPVKYPSSWTVDKLKLASIIRLADYCQIDETRAPSFLMALRKPAGISKLHWQFQNKLLQPIQQNDKLIYTSKRPFTKEESHAWWLCYDTLKLIDIEIRRTNRMLNEAHANFTFQVQGIMNVESPERLAESIKTAKWLPIDVNIQVTNVAHLAKTLGGSRLYGDDKKVPIRELIQNASDAIRARRVYENKPNDWGEITIREGQDDDKFWIEVEDNGIGMSEEVIKGPFLDFGKSYWGSDLMLKEFPGLISKGFTPTGQYGIGFFSIFMISDKVEVMTLRAGRARSQTLVLEFEAGLDTRPILHIAADSLEVIDNGGTKIRLWLKPGVRKEDGSFEIERYGNSMKLDQLVEWLCPSIDVNITYERDLQSKKLIKANDWLTISGEKLIKRLGLDDGQGYSSSDKLKAELKQLRFLKENGKIVGRACILSERRRNRKVAEHGIVTIGGFRANTLRAYSDYSLFGILIGKTNSAVRNLGFPVLNEDTLSKWATEQASLYNFVENIKKPEMESLSSVICHFGGSPESLGIGTWERGILSLNDIDTWSTLPNELLIIEEDYKMRTENTITLFENNVIAIRELLYRGNFLIYGDYDQEIRWPLFPTIKLTSKNEIPINSIYGNILKILAKRWNTTIDKIIKVSDFKVQETVIGKRGRKSIKMTADIIRNPLKEFPKG